MVDISAVLTLILFLKQIIKAAAISMQDSIEYEGGNVEPDEAMSLVGLELPPLQKPLADPFQPHWTQR